MAVNDLIQLTVDDTNSVVNLGRGMYIEACSTYSNPQWGTCQVYFTDISVSENNSTGRKITISSAKATAHFLFISREFVVYSFDDVFIPFSSFHGIISSNSFQSFQPTTEESLSAKRVLEKALNQKPFRCSYAGACL